MVVVIGLIVHKNRSWCCVSSGDKSYFVQDIQILIFTGKSLR